MEQPIDAALIRELRFLGIAEDSWPVLALLPLIQVAWADGTVQPAEREVILAAGRDHFRLDHEGQHLLETWLAHPPSEQYLVRGRAALHLLSTHFPELARVDNVLDLAEAVARAAGGIFGFQAVDVREQEVLKELRDVLAVPPERRWDWMEDLEVGGSDPEDEPEDEGRTLDIAVPEGFVVSVTYQAADAPRAEDGAVLVRHDHDPPVTLPLPEAGASLGRSRVCDIWIRSDAKVSRHHALLYRSEGAWRLQDNQSTTGTWVNGERILDRRMFGGEEIVVGEVEFRFDFVRDEAEASADEA